MCGEVLPLYTTVPPANEPLPGAVPVGVVKSPNPVVLYTITRGSELAFSVKASFSEAAFVSEM